MSITDIGKEAAENQSSGQSIDPDDYSPFDVTGMHYLKTHPQTAPAGTARTVRYFVPGDPNDDDVDADRGYNGLIIDNPYVINDDELASTVILENDSQKGDDFKLVDLSDETTDVLTASGPADFFDEDAEERPERDFSDINGIDFAGNSMYGDVRAYIGGDEAKAMIEEAEDADGRKSVEELESASDVQVATLRDNDVSTMSDLEEMDIETVADMGDFGVDQLIVKLTGNAGRGATQCLDVHGSGSADVVRDDDYVPELNERGWPDSNHALVEYFDNDDDNYTPPRFARDPEIRPDIEGEEVAYLLQRRSEVVDSYDGNSYFTTVLVQGDDGEWGSVSPTDEFEPSDLLVAATEWVEGYPSKAEVLAIREHRGVDIDDDLEERIEEWDIDDDLAENLDVDVEELKEGVKLEASG